MSHAPRRISHSPGRALNIFALLPGAVALLATVWIILPAPSYHVWLFSVLVSEWSLAFGLLGLLGIGCGLLARKVSGGRLWRVSLLTGGAALLLSLYPLGSSLAVARARNVSLSSGQYVSGLRSAWEGDAATTAANNFQTYTYATVDGNALRLDAYLPAGGAESNGAGVLVIHGGSWSAGARSDLPQWDGWLARQGFAVFDVDYRLAPQPNWQTATGDIKCAVAWVKRHAASFGVSPDRLALLGRSAGGHLALLAAYSVADARLPSVCTEEAAGAEPVSSRPAGEGVRAVVSFYGPTDLLWAYDHPANRLVIDGPATLRRFVGGDPQASGEIRERFYLASPVAHVNGRTPPTLLVHGGHDQLVRSENTRLLGRKLEEAGVPHEELFIPYAQHGFDYNFNGWGAQVVRPVLLNFLSVNTGPR